MRTAWETYPIELSGGLITNVSPLQQGMNFPGSATTLVNYEPSLEGGYKKVLGYSKWVDFALPGTADIQAVILTAARDTIAVRGGKYYFSQDKSDWVEKLDLSATVGSTIRHVPFNFNGTPKVVMVDGVNKPVFYRADTHVITQDTAASADVLGANFVAEFKNRIFFGNGSMLIYTAPYAETDYTPGNGAGVINVGDEITGLIVFRTELIIFCRDQIKRLTGNSPSDFVLLDITKKSGCVASDTIQEVGGDILYLGPDGVRYLSATEKIEDFGLQRASEQIQKELNALFNSGGIFCSLVVREKAQYRIFRFDSEQTPQFSRGYLATKFIDQQPSGMAWSSLMGFKVVCTDSKQFADEEVVIFSDNSSQVYQMEFGNSFDGADIECIFKIPFNPITDPRVRKTVYKHSLYIKTSGTFSLTARLLLDYEQVGTVQPSEWVIGQNSSGVSIYGEGVYGVSYYSGNLNSVYVSPVVGSAFTFSLEYREKSINPAFSLDTIILEFRTNDRK